MQIVRDLAGYSYGRSDLVRRAMSKKKASVMEQERRNFVYGNEAEGVKGCIANGIDEQVANHIYDEMVDFAKYAFNKSHAAAYAVVAYQTAYLKYYYPVEFMAALLTSVIDNPDKVSSYIMSLRKMGIEILPPDINEGEGGFSVGDKSIRYGLSAIKGLGWPVIEAIVSNRKELGRYDTIKDLAERLSGKEINKRTMESLIKSGALDSLKGNRRQKMTMYVKVLDSVNEEKKHAITGQMSLFDFVGEEDKAAMDIPYPDVEEYDTQTLLAMEKEVLGVYVSGHPLKDYEALWEKSITNTCADFLPDENMEYEHIEDRQECVVGGIIQSKTVKLTRNNTMMAFLTLEDMLGSVEVIVFPRDYDRVRNMLVEDEKVFIKGRVAIEEDKGAKIILTRLKSFDDVSSDVYIRFKDKNEYMDNIDKVGEVISTSDGKDRIIVVCTKENEMKILPHSMSLKADEETISRLKELLGNNNVGVKQGSVSFD